jgi:gamma-glutamylcysteine synthetase
MSLRRVMLLAVIALLMVVSQSVAAMQLDHSSDETMFLELEAQLELESQAEIAHAEMSDIEEQLDQAKETHAYATMDELEATLLEEASVPAPALKVEAAINAGESQLAAASAAAAAATAQIKQLESALGSWMVRWVADSSTRCLHCTIRSAHSIRSTM